MKTFIKITTVLLGVLGFLIIVIYWFEAEKEVRILCSMFQKAQSVEDVRRTLDTGNLLRYTVNPNEVVVHSIYTLNSTECTVRLSDEATVTGSVYRQYIRLEGVAGGFAAVLTFGLSVFQLLLALGVPWGEWAWGGFHKKLPGSLRIWSFISFVLLIIAGFSVLSSTDFIDLIPQSISKIVVYLLTFIFLGSVVGNFNSPNAKERKTMIPLSIFLLCSYLVIVVYLLG